MQSALKGKSNILRAELWDVWTLLCTKRMENSEAMTSTHSIWRFISTDQENVAWKFVKTAVLE